jgi:predicted RNA-binding Zn-ribbon protein involved in translation (DUF1610 family)
MRKLNTVHSRCPDCGDVELAPARLKFRLCMDTRSWSCCFRCPQCGFAVAHETQSHTARAALVLGAEIEAWQLPAELEEPRPGGPAWTLDDVLDFHTALQDDRTLSELG